MEEQNKVINEVVKELKDADAAQLETVIEKWFEAIRMAGLKIGAQMISAAVFSEIQRHLKKAAKPSLRDYQRCIDAINKIITKQLTQQNDLNEDNEDDRTTEENS